MHIIERIGGNYEAQEVPFGGPAPARGETEQIEANGRLGELFEDLDLALPDDAADEDKRRELYAVAASIFA